MPLPAQQLAHAFARAAAILTGRRAWAFAAGDAAAVGAGDDGSALDEAEARAAAEAVAAGRPHPGTAGVGFPDGARGGLCVAGPATPALRDLAAAAGPALAAALAGDAATDRFLDVLAHDLRTPLTPALLLVGLIGEDPSLSPAVREHLALLAEALAWQQRLTDDLLDHARLRGGRLGGAPGAADLREAAERALAWCRRDAEDKRQRIELRFAAASAAVRADPARLERVAWNLLAHAVAATPEGGAIALEIATAPGAARLIVSDDGIPLPVEDVASFFAALPGSGRGPERRAGGQGAGLIVARELVEAWGGTLVAEASSNGGRFVLTLPIADGG